MGCWSVALVVFFSTLDYQILSSPYVIVSVCHRLRISSSPNHSSPYYLYMYGFKIAK